MDHTAAPPSLPDSRPVPAPWLPWRRELAVHLIAMFVTLAVVALGQRLVDLRYSHLDPLPGLVPGVHLPLGLRIDVADLHVPFHYTDDALLILPFVKATVERGSHWRSERLGAPGIQELHDFPVVDHLHFGIIWLMGRFIPDPVVVFNLFHLLTYPLTTLTGMFVLRRFGLSVPASATGGILYAFQPYHQLRGLIHYFLSAYFVIPFTLMVTLWICQGRLPFFRRTDEGRYRWSLRTADTGWAVLIAIATASAGAYYAFFACALLACAAMYSWVALRTWRAAASGWLVVVVIVATGVLNHLPAFAYQMRNGANTRPTQRWSEEAEMYGMKITQLVLPMPGHNNVEIDGRVLVDFAGLRARYDTALRPFHQYIETYWDPFGMVASVGFIALLAICVLPVKRPWPLGPLAALTLFGTLLATVGGLGNLFNLLVTPQIRCLNRISIYLAFLALFAVCWWLDWYFQSRTGRMKKLRWPTFVAIITLGIWDQTDVSWFPQVRPPAIQENATDAVRARIGERFWADRQFFDTVETLAPDGMVFCLPLTPYPETAPYEEPGSPGRVANYDMVRGYLHTRGLRWSYGAMKGREWDLWQRSVAFDPVPRMLERIVLTGFDGLLVDRRGLNPARFERLMAEIDSVLGHGSARAESDDHTLFFFGLQAYRRDLEANYGAARFAAMADAERNGISWLWLKGFDSYEAVGYERRQRWSQANGLVVVVNPSDQPRACRVQMILHTWMPVPVPLRIEGGDIWTDELELTNLGTRVVRNLTIPPGRHKILFRSQPPSGYSFGDSRNLVFGVKDFSLQNLP